MNHPAGFMVSVGGALVSGARLALSTGFDPEHFWSEVRRYGATVVFYAGEMARPLVDSPAAHGERNHPLRLFAGSGMRPDVWRRLHERFGVGVLEFYASTERNLVLANASGEKVGALGRPLPGGAELAIARYDFAQRALVERGDRLVRCDAGTAGLAIVRVPDHVTGPAVRRGAFEPQDRWLVGGDVLRRDRDGDYWFVDRLANMVHTTAGAVATPHVEAAIYRLAEVALAVAYGALDDTGHERLVACVVARDSLEPERVTRLLCEELEAHELPRRIRRVAEVPLNEGFRPIKSALRHNEPEALEELCFDAAAGRYVSV